MYLSIIVLLTMSFRVLSAQMCEQETLQPFAKSIAVNSSKLVEVDYTCVFPKTMNVRVHYQANNCTVSSDLLTILYSKYCVPKLFRINLKLLVAVLSTEADKDR